MAIARSSFDDNAICYVLPIFVDDVMFAHYGAKPANGPESKTTLFRHFAGWRHRGRTLLHAIIVSFEMRFFIQLSSNWPIFVADAMIT